MSELKKNDFLKNILKTKINFKFFKNIFESLKIIPNGRLNMLLLLMNNVLKETNYHILTHISIFFRVLFYLFMYLFWVDSSVLT